LFGAMRAGDLGRLQAVPRGDVQRLLGFVALHPRTAHRREVLAELLWPDADRPRRSLSDCAYRLRTTLGDGWIDVDADTVALAAGVWVDAGEFDRLAASGSLDDLEAAVVLYAAELVPGIYDDWAVEHRAARHQSFVATLGRLVDAREQSGDVERALLDARRLILAEPLHEPAHQSYLRLLGRQHRYADARSHFEQLRHLLAQELGVAPLPSTTEIVEQLIRERDAATIASEQVRFVGRSLERGVLLDAVERLLAGRGSAVCVEGEAGIGKSRLIEETARSARWRGATVLVGDVREVPEASPLTPLARALAPLLTGSLRFEIENAVGPTMLAALAALHPAWRQDPTTTSTRSTRPGAGQLEQAMRVLGQVAAGVGDVMLVLDDMHWATPATWEAVAALAEGFVPAGGLLVLAYRRPEIEQTAGWSVLEGWDRRSLATVLAIDPLDIDEIAELVAEHAGDQDAERVMALTGGNPFHVTEWLAHERGATSVDPATMVLGRLASLTPERRRALEGAAVLGESIPFRAWLDVTVMAPVELAAISDHLVGGRWLAPTVTGYAFTHDLVRASVYEQIPPRRRRTLHERAADSLSRLEPGNARSRAYHLDRAGLATAAAAAYRATAESHRQQLAMRDAADSLQRALELLPTSLEAERLAVSVQLADVCEVIGDHALQRPALTEAIAIARRSGDTASLMRALLLAGSVAARTTDTGSAEAILAEATVLAEQLDDHRALIEAAYRRADHLAQSGRWPESKQTFLDALDLLTEQPDPWLRARVLRGLAIAANRTGDPAESVRWLELALAEHRLAGDTINELVTMTNLLAAYYDNGTWDELIATAEQAMPIARRLGDRVSLGVITHNLGLAALATGDRAAATRLLDEAGEYFHATQRRRLLGLVINARGLLLEDDGDIPGAIEQYEAALDVAREIDARSEIAFAAHDLGALLYKVGRVAEAEPLLRLSAETWEDAGHPLMRAKSEAYVGLCLVESGSARERDEAQALSERGLALARSGDVAGEHPQAWLWALAQLLRRLGRPDQAVEVLRTASAEVHRQALTIRDPARRRDFERVPLNHAITTELSDETATPTSQEVLLAHRDAPLGRPLRRQELVRVRWTLAAPDDAAIGGKAERRRHRLRRLLTEAALHEAAPTDDDLARALGVSRRTILRDIAVLGGQTPTRRRVARVASSG
jgi:DNA-binding SARP family transcriptional activator